MKTGNCLITYRFTIIKSVCTDRTGKKKRAGLFRLKRMNSSLQGIKLTPNPASTTLKLQYQSERKETAQITVVRSFRKGWYTLKARSFMRVPIVLISSKLIGFRVVCILLYLPLRVRLLEKRS